MNWNINSFWIWVTWSEVSWKEHIYVLIGFTFKKFHVSHLVFCETSNWCDIFSIDTITARRTKLIYCVWPWSDKCLYCSSFCCLKFSCFSKFYFNSYLCFCLTCFLFCWLCRFCSCCPNFFGRSRIYFNFSFGVGFLSGS